MNANAILEKGEEQMTDYQFKQIIRMVVSIAKNASDSSESALKIVRELESLLPENERNGN